MQRIVPRVAAKLFVMDFEILKRSAILATPAVAVKDLEFQLSIRFGTELGSEPLWKDFDHEAF
jgi:hypothetical protein